MNYAGPAISTSSLSKTYRTGARRSKVHALSDLSLNVELGEVFGFLGQNGAGKSTTIKILTGLLRASTGRALICGEPAGSAGARSAIGYLPENPSLPARSTVREFIELAARMSGRGPESRGLAKAWLDRLELGPIAARPGAKLSKGQTQLTALAAAVIGSPNLLILDEPMSGLDPVARKRVRDLLIHARDAGATIFLSSHVLSDMELLCDRVGLVRGGRMVGIHTLDDIRETGTAGAGRLEDLVLETLTGDEPARLVAGGER